MQQPEQHIELRDYFASKAMQGELASQYDGCEYFGDESYKRLAENSYKIADAMMEARQK